MSLFLLEDLMKFMVQLMRHEGSKRDAAGMHVAYRCPAGKWTIGYGHNLEANPIFGLGANSRITEEHARRILEGDINKFAPRLLTTLPWISSLAPARRGVLLNMAFNLGIPGLLKFNNTLANVKMGNYSMAANGMLQSLWARQVGRRAQELSQQMRTGEWQNVL